MRLSHRPGPDGTALPWVLNGVSNATLLGTNSGGIPETNPIVWPGFDRAVQKSNRRGP